jgi:cystathionine beta-lyase/cystathionine gamma-synthase
LQSGIRDNSKKTVLKIFPNPARMTNASIPREQRMAGGLLDSLIRLSVGLEHADDLIADLDAALAKV